MMSTMHMRTALTITTRDRLDMVAVAVVAGTAEGRVLEERASAKVADAAVEVAEVAATVSCLARADVDAWNMRAGPAKVGIPQVFRIGSESRPQQMAPNMSHVTHHTATQLPQVRHCQLELLH